MLYGPWTTSVWLSVTSWTTMICLLWVEYCMWVIQHVASLYLLWPTFWMHYFFFSWCTFSYLLLHLQILVLLLWAGTVNAAKEYSESHQHTRIQTSTPPHTHTHSCIHDEIVEQQRRSGVNLYKITPQVSILVREKVVSCGEFMENSFLWWLSNVIHLLNSFCHPHKTCVNSNVIYIVKV